MSKVHEIIKRNGSKEEVHFEKIRNRLLNLCNSSQRQNVDIDKICHKIMRGLYPGVSTVELDTLASETCASMVKIHIEYLHLAGRIVVSKLHKETKSKFIDVITDLYNAVDPITGESVNNIDDQVYECIRNNATKLENVLNYDRDYYIEYFGIKTLEAVYLLKINNKIVERPQHMFMRVAIGIHRTDIDSAIETYNLMSEKWFIHATPTLFNSGTKRPQLSSCFLLTMRGDNTEEIHRTMNDCATIAEHDGGIGLNAHCIKSKDLQNELASEDLKGLTSVIQLFNNRSRNVNKGTRRPGSFAIYIEPWHPDILEFLNVRKNHGDESKKARDIFTALWIPDLFMKRVKDNGSWTLMEPSICTGLFDCWGDNFEKLYESYESQGKGVKTMSARTLWKEILDSQIETGTPYMLYKDSCNSKSNHQHLGTIKCSNLCTEIIEYSAPDEVAVCNLASISLTKFVDRKKKTFDFDSLVKVTEVITNNLNKIIDINYYPLVEAKNSNFRHRPIGIGVQGLADVFALLRFPFESKEAMELNKRIFETIYFSALRKSCKLAKEFGTYESYEGSPVSRGILQPDMWNVQCSDKLDWPQLRSDIAKYGVRNSLLVAPMPTASTSQILGNNECFEPFTSNIYIRRVLSGEYVVLNRYLIEDLIQLGVWSDDMSNAIIANKGSVQNINGLPDQLKELYKTVWEIPQTTIINMAADRAPFIDQSQSMNLHVAAPNYQTLTTLHFLAWKKGLKTGMYYLRTRPAADPIQFTIDKSRANSLVLSDKVKQMYESLHGNGNISEKEIIEKLSLESEASTCSLINKENCRSCQG